MDKKGGGKISSVSPAMNGQVRVSIFERIVWEKMEPDIDLYYGEPPQYVIMRTTRAHLIEAHIWCPGCRNGLTICQFHEERIPKGRFKHMREREAYE